MNNPNWSKTTKHLVSVGLVLFGLYLFYLSRSVLTMVVIGALVAFLLMPLVDFLQARLRTPRLAAVLIAYLMLIIIILLAPLIFLPPVINGFQFLANIDYQILIDNSMAWLEASLRALKALQLSAAGFSLDLSPVIDPALNFLEETGTGITPSLPSFETITNSLRSALTVTYGLATNVAGTVFAGVLAFIVTILSAIYISLDGEKFAASFVETVPAVYREEVSILLSRLNRIWRAYFRGQLNLMIIIGLITWLGNMALGLPGAFALGVIAGVLELIPNLGPFLAAIPAVVVALIQGSTYMAVSNLVFALIVVGFYIAVQQFENTLVVPRILGEAVNLHPLVVITGVLVGANVAGILGALLAAPVIASGREIVRYFYLKILGEVPFPPEEQEPVENSPSLLDQGKTLLQRLQHLSQYVHNTSASTPQEPGSAASKEEGQTALDQQQGPPQQL